MIDPARIQYLRSLVASASEGPWKCHEDATGGGDLAQVDESGGVVRDLVRHVYYSEDGLFIAEARTAVPELLDEVERLRAAVENIRKMADGLRHDMTGKFIAVEIDNRLRAALGES